MKTLPTCFLCLIFLLGARCAAGQEAFVVKAKNSSGFPLCTDGRPAAIWTDITDDRAVLRAAADLRKDMQRVTGTLPDTVAGSRSILIATLGKSVFIDSLLRANQLQNELVGRNEKYIITSLHNPAAGIAEALVIAGSDRRGTIYGIYALSAQIGVSPWYYWADVPVEHHTDLYVSPGIHTEGEPAVRYRGIFLNDERPALADWAQEVFGGFNHRFYAKVFELILRLKGNFIWPAMWGSAFYDDDPLNAQTADEYGILIGTSHHEPMGRAHDEWRRYGEGAWNYAENGKNLRQFWTAGMKRMKDYESVVTIGMRGNGDEPMSETCNIDLLQKIVGAQRTIISAVTGKKAEETPQVWALYKEVQDYFDRGMRVPDDVTLLLCDDNWGNVRRLPPLGAQPRKGGYGMYYHLDYVGEPRNYKWVNVSQIQRIWEQMNLAYRYGVDRLWIVNVGDLKPMEFPMSFFLDMAWNPDRFDAENLMTYTEAWCAQQFGAQYAPEAARLLNRYTQYNHRVTPELLDDKTYSLENYDEFETVVADYRALALDAHRLCYLLPAQYRDAFDELILFPIDACCNLYELYYAVAKNRHYAANADIRANEWADRAKQAFVRDSLLTLHYNRDIAAGKWPHMMDQVRIGYTGWQQPEKSVMPEVRYVIDTAAAREKIFAEADGYVSIEAENFARKHEDDGIRWVVIPDFGKTLSGLTTEPVTASPAASYVEYEVDLHSTGTMRLHLLFAPTLDFSGTGLRCGVSIDGGAEQLVDIDRNATKQQREERRATAVNETVTTWQITTPGRHVIRFRAIDPGLVLQKIILDTGGLKPSYLGAPQSDLTD